MNMLISPISNTVYSNTSYNGHLYNAKSKNLPINQSSPVNFEGKIRDNVLYTTQYLQCNLQRNRPTPAVCDRYVVRDIENDNLALLPQRSKNPEKDLEDAYNLYMKDFGYYFHYYNYKGFKNHYARDCVSTFVLKSNDKTIGFYSLSIVGKDTLYIDDVNLDTKYRNTKKGNEILNACWKEINEIAEENDCSKIGLHVNSNKKHLVSLYKKFGFEIVDDNATVYPDKGIGYYMEKKVSSEID